MVPKLTPWELPVREGGCEEHSQRTVPRVSVARGGHSLGLICDIGLGDVQRSLDAESKPSLSS